jgi:phospholipase C
MIARKWRFGISALVASVALGACSNGPGANSSPPIGAADHHKSGSTPIQHIVLMIQENRSFNNIFATFPGATGTTTGEELVKVGNSYQQKKIQLTEVPLEDKHSLTHLYRAYSTAYDDGAMDAFNLIKAVVSGKAEGKAPYQYVNPSDVQPYWTIGQDYALADEMFQTQGSGSFTAHQDLIRGGTKIKRTESIIDDPSNGSAWGCDSPTGTKTSLFTTARKFLKDKGPFPCTTDFPKAGANYHTLSDLLDAKGVSWKYYTPEYQQGTTSALWNAFDVIAAVRYGSEWGTNVSWPETNIFSDISNGTLPAMSWVIPDAVNSDHPGYESDTGPSWVASVVNAVGQSSYWNSTAVVIVWDDWGGLYDPVAPPLIDKLGGLGFRVGMLVASPYTPQSSSCAGRGAVHTQYEFGSIVKFIEETFNLGSLGTTDQRATSIANLFNFNQSPCPFQSIPSKRSRAFFLHQKPSGLPVDTE